MTSIYQEPFRFGAVEFRGDPVPFVMMNRVADGSIHYACRNGIKGSVPGDHTGKPDYVNSLLGRVVDVALKIDPRDAPYSVSWPPEGFLQFEVPGHGKFGFSPEVGMEVLALLKSAVSSAHDWMGTDTDLPSDIPPGPRERGGMFYVPWRPGRSYE